MNLDFLNCETAENQAVALDTSNNFDRAWHTGLLHKLKSYGNSSTVFGLIWYFVSNKWLELVLNVNSYKSNEVNAGMTPYYSDLGQQRVEWGGLVISFLEKFNMFHLARQVTQVLLMWKWASLENSSYAKVAFLL